MTAFEKMMEKRFGIPFSRRPMVILAFIARESGVSVSDLRGHCRLQKLVRARNRAYVHFRKAGFSYPRIGQLMNRDHATVMHGVRKAAEQ